MSKPIGVVDNNLKVCRAPEPEELEANQSSSNLEFVYNDSLADQFLKALEVKAAWDFVLTNPLTGPLARNLMYAEALPVEIRSKILSSSVCKKDPASEECGRALFVASLREEVKKTSKF